MKKIIPGFLCLLLITTCGFEMPKSITFKGNPGLYIPLGSPFAGVKPEDRLENLISQENLRKMMGSKQVEVAGMYDDLKVYEVAQDLAVDLNIDPETLTYLVRYPLADMPLDLERYTQRAMDAINEKEQFTIPPLPPLPPGYPAPNMYVYLTEDDPVITDNGKPFIKIALADMKKLVMWVEAEPNGIFGLEVDYDPDLANNLELKIPGLGFDYWMKGIPTDANGNPNPTGTPAKLRFYKYYPYKTKFYPREQIDDRVFQKPDLDDDGNLLIYARISGSLQSKTYEPSLIFDWEKAMIDTVNGTNGGSFKGVYPINNNLSEFLGEGVSFKRVEGYMYMSSIGAATKEAHLSIGIYEDDDLSFDTPPKNGKDGPLKLEKLHLDDLEPKNFPDGDIFTKGDIKAFSPQSLKAPIRMEEYLNYGGSYLKVKITIEEMEINKADVETNSRTAIKFDMLVLLPLDLQVETEAPNVIGTIGKGKDEKEIDVNRDYVMLEIINRYNKKPPEGEEGEDDEEGDLFGRTPGGNNALQAIDYLEIGLKFSESDINIINPGRLAILVKTKTDTDTVNRLLEFKNKASLRFNAEVLRHIPFSPKFDILLKNDEGKVFGSFMIIRQNKPKFDFKLDVTAWAALEYTLGL